MNRLGLKTGDSSALAFIRASGAGTGRRMRKLGIANCAGKRWGLALLLGGAVWLAGCGQENAPEEERMPEAVQRACDWRTKGFAVSGELREEQAFWPAEYIRWEHEDVRYEDAVESIFNQVEELGVYEGKICRLHGFYAQEGEEVLWKTLMESYDVFLRQTTVEKIDPGKFGVEGGFVAVTGMDVTDAERITVRVRSTEQEEEGGFRQTGDYIVRTGPDGIGEKTDVLPAALQNGIADKMLRECFCDAAGNCYIRGAYPDAPARSLYVFDGEGNLLTQQKVQEDEILEKPFRMPEGELVFPVRDRMEKSARLIWFDPQEGQMRVLASLEKESIEQVYGIQGNDLYYESFERGIVRWNIVTGERTLVFSFEENGVLRFYDTMLALREGQPPVFRMYGTVNGAAQDWLVPFSLQRTEKADAVRIVNLNRESPSVKECVAAASRWNPGFSFVYETCAEQDRDDLRTRIMAEMAAGAGPDILYVSLADMRRMQREGMLADLREVLDGKLLDQILPGVVELGTVDGVFVGLAPKIDVQTTVTLRSIWERDTWSLGDILGLLDTGDFTGLFCQGSTPYAKQAVLHWLTMFGLQEGSLIDWERQESHFEGELFRRCLEIAKVYGSEEPFRETTWLGPGGCLGETAGAGIQRFDELSEKYGEDLLFVGMPTKGDCGSYLTGDGVLVINGAVSDPGAVSAYVACLLSDAIQYPQNRFDGKESVRRIFPEEILIVETVSGTKAFWKDIPLRLREDGTTVLNDYRDFLASCVPGPAAYEEILAIVWEDAQSCLSGDKSAAEAAKTVDRRIQVWLDEGGH